jgi:hypothetical protein
LVVSCILLSATGAQVSWVMPGMLKYIVGVPWVERGHYVQCIELRNVLAFFGCIWASLAVGAVSPASHSVFGGSGRMIPPLQAVYIAWALGPAYPPSSP